MYLTREDKVNNLQERDRIEELILELEKSDDSAIIPTVKELKNILLNLENNKILEDNKMYLSEIIENEKPVFGSNNLIISPIGSGKSTFIEKLLIENSAQYERVIMLVSNRFLKESVIPEDNQKRKELADRRLSERMFTSTNKIKYGEGNYQVHVMSYHEFGQKIQNNDDFVADINFIFCDEVHSLVEYREYNNSPSLTHAIRFLFQKHENKNIYYFTATEENLLKFEKKQPGALKNILRFDYRNHPDIKKYMALSEYKINNIEQIRPHLKARLKSFNYFKYKGLAFNRTISGMKSIAKIAEEEGFKPLLLWSDINETHILSEEQLKAREYIINNEKIPDPYNLLIINSSMREGWNLKDDKVRLAIINTTNETDLIQSSGRIRNDIDLLIYKTNEKDVRKVNESFVFPKKYLNIPLKTEDKEKICDELNLLSAKGEVLKWRGINKILKDNNYIVENERMYEDGKRIALTTVKISES